MTVRRWGFVEPGDSGEPVITVMTETEILDFYYEWWSRGMLRVHKAPMITEHNCIEDFVVVHWASEEGTKQ